MVGNRESAPEINPLQIGKIIFRGNFEKFFHTGQVQVLFVYAAAGVLVKHNDSKIVLMQYRTDPGHIFRIQTEFGTG